MATANQSIAEMVNTSDDKDAVLKYTIFKYLSYWYWFILALVFAFSCAFLYLRYTTPVYSASAKILIRNEKSGGVSQQDILSDLNLFNTKTNVGDELEILKTSYVMKEVVKELELNVSYYSVGKIKNLEYYKTAPFYARILQQTPGTPWQQFIIEFKEGGFHVNGKGIDANYQFADTVKGYSLAFMIEKKGIGANPGDEFILNISSVESTANAYAGGITAEFINKQSNVIRISTNSTIPRKGVDVLNKVFEVYNRLSKNDKNQIADSTINFINERLEIVSVELAGVEKNVEDFKQKNKLSVDMGQQAGIVLSNISEIEKQLIQQEVQLNVVSSIENHVKSNTNRVVPGSMGIADPGYSSLVEKYNGLVLERDNQLQTSRADNPLVKNYDLQIENVRKDLLTSLANIHQGMQISKDELTRKNNELAGKLYASPAKERAFNDIARQQEVKQQLYLYLLQKREETAVSKSGIVSNCRLIESAKSGIPISPDSSNTFTLALVFGLAVPFAIIYLSIFLNNRVKERRDITSITNVPIIGELGHNDSQNEVIVTSGSRSALAEQFRAVRTNLQFILRGKEKQIIMLTSSMSGEGKSFLSLNLAAFLAVSGKKTVIVELDLRKPKIASQLGLDNRIGFSNYMISDMHPSELPVPTEIHPNLFIVCSGPVPPNPAELLLQDKTAAFFAWLKDNFDFIVLDTPPIGLVTDARLIGAYADACLFVVRQNFTLKQQIHIANDLVANEKISNLAILVNDVRISRHSAYGSGYGYGFGYGYGYGYGYGANNDSGGYYGSGKKESANPIKKLFNRKK